MNSVWLKLSCWDETREISPTLMCCVECLQHRLKMLSLSACRCRRLLVTKTKTSSWSTTATCRSQRKPRKFTRSWPRSWKSSTRYNRSRVFIKSSFWNLTELDFSSAKFYRLFVILNKCVYAFKLLTRFPLRRNFSALWCLFMNNFCCQKQIFCLWFLQTVTLCDPFSWLSPFI